MCAICGCPVPTCTHRTQHAPCMGSATDARAQPRHCPVAPIFCIFQLHALTSPPACLGHRNKAYLLCASRTANKPRAAPRAPAACPVAPPQMPLHVLRLRSPRQMAGTLLLWDPTLFLNGLLGCCPAGPDTLVRCSSLGLRPPPPAAVPTGGWWPASTGPLPARRNQAWELAKLAGLQVGEATFMSASH